MPHQTDKELIKEAVREVWDERAVTYANGAMKFANGLTDSWSQLIDAFDGFFLRNFLEEHPEAAKDIIKARVAAIKRTRHLMDSKIHELEKMGKPKTRRKPSKRARTKKS